MRQPVSSSCHLKAAVRGRSRILIQTRYPRWYYPLRVQNTSPGYQLPRVIPPLGYFEITRRRPECPGHDVMQRCPLPLTPTCSWTNQMSVLSVSANQKPPLPDPRHDPVHREPGPAARPAAAVVARALVAEVDLGGWPDNKEGSELCKCPSCSPVAFSGFRLYANCSFSSI